MPRVSEGTRLLELGVQTAMDLSDGLLEDLGKLCKASGVGAMVYLDKIPVDSTLPSMFPRCWQDLALGGGEDYELLFTASASVMENALDALQVRTTVIGEIVDSPKTVRVVDRTGKLVQVNSPGWEHFRGV